MAEIRDGNAAATAELEDLLRAGVVFFLKRWARDGRARQGHVLEIFRLAVFAIQTAAVGNAPQLLSLVIRLTKRYGESTAELFQDCNKAQGIAETGHGAQALAAMLAEISARDRAAFVSYYVKGNSVDHVLNEFDMSADEFQEAMQNMRALHLEQVPRKACAATDVIHSVSPEIP